MGIDIFVEAVANVRKDNISLYAYEDEIPDVFNLYKEVEIADAIIAMRTIDIELETRMMYIDRIEYAESVGGIIAAAFGLLKTVIAFIIKMVLGFKGIALVLIGAIVAYMIKRSKSNTVSAAASGGGGGGSFSSAGSGFSKEELDDILDVIGGIFHDKTEALKKFGGDLTKEEIDKLGSVAVAKGVIDERKLRALKEKGEISREDLRKVLDPRGVGKVFRADRNAFNDGTIILTKDFNVEQVVSCVRALLKNKNHRITKEIQKSLKDKPLPYGQINFDSDVMKKIRKYMESTSRRDDSTNFSTLLSFIATVESSDVMTKCLSTIAIANVAMNPTPYNFATMRDTINKLNIDKNKGRDEKLRVNIWEYANENVFQNNREEFDKKINELFEPNFMKRRLMLFGENENRFGVVGSDNYYELRKLLPELQDEVTKKYTDVSEIDIELLQSITYENSAIVVTGLVYKDKNDTRNKDEKLDDLRNMRYVNEDYEKEMKNISRNKISAMSDKATKAANEILAKLEKPNSGEALVNVKNIRFALEACTVNMRAVVSSIVIIQNIFTNISHPIHSLVHEAVIDIIKASLSYGIAKLL